jgi:hypothetical protein
MKVHGSGRVMTIGKRVQNYCWSWFQAGVLAIYLWLKTWWRIAFAGAISSPRVQRFLRCMPTLDRICSADLTKRGLPSRPWTWCSSGCGRSIHALVARSDLSMLVLWHCLHQNGSYYWTHLWDVSSGASDEVRQNVSVALLLCNYITHLDWTFSHICHTACLVCLGSFL